MNELDKLRGMLLDSGTEFLDHNSDLTIGYYTDPHSVTESMDGTLIVTGLTAEQVMLTLGPGECHNASEYPRMFFYCSECGCAHKRNRAYVDMPRYCPNCGRRCIG